jgi:dynein heavy chain
MISQAFDDASSSAACFRLFESFGPLLNRPIIQQLIGPKYYLLLESFNRDIEDVEVMFEAEKNDPPMHPNMAPVTGAISWTHELKDRLSKTLEKLQSLNHPFMSTEDARMVKSKYKKVTSVLDTYEQNLFTQWTENIIDDSEANLHKPILLRDEQGLLEVNFDPKVVALLKEVKYFENLQIKVPEKAKNIFTKSETYRNYVLSLEHIVKQYNAFHTTLLPVEAPLISVRLDDIDKRCEEGVTSLDWTHPRLDTFIKETAQVVGELSNILQTTRNNISRIEETMKSWYASPIIERKDGKKLLNMEEKPAKVRYITFRIGGSNLMV